MIESIESAALIFLDMLRDALTIKPTIKPIKIDIVAIGVVAGAVGSIWAVVDKIIKPVSKMLNSYRESLARANDRLDEANEKLEKMDAIINEHKKEIRQFKLDAEMQKQATKSLLRFVLNSECMRSLIKGYRAAGTSKDLEPIYQAYKGYGMNGLVGETYEKYINLPTKDELDARRAAEKRKEKEE